MEEARLHTLGQVKAFLDRTAEGAFRFPKAERHRFIERVLTRFDYAQHGRVNRGVLLRYLERMTGLSRQQVTRLVREYRQDGTLSCRHGASRHAFPSRFTATDVALLAEVDALHGTVSGPATKKLMERALLLFGDARFERLAGSRCPICTTCGAGFHTSARGGTGPRRGPPVCPSASAAPHSRMGCRAISASIVCIKAIRMA